MKLPDTFWIRILNGHDQRTWLGKPAKEKGFVVVQSPCNPEVNLGKLRIRIPAGTRVVRRGVEQGKQYRFPVLVGKDRLPGEIWWTIQEDRRLDVTPVEVVNACMNRTKAGEVVVEVRFNHSYHEAAVYALRPHVAQRLLGMIHTSLHPEET